jgi:hypothetical protein
MTRTLWALAATVPSGNGHGWVGNWSPGIGDPTLVGWFTVVAYFVAALACWKVRGGAPDNAPGLRRKEHLFWIALVLALLFLCINKQLDLQTAFTEFMRSLARQQGWYDTRFTYQLAFIAAMAMGLPVGIGLCIRLTRGLATSVKTAGVGLVAIACFVLIRAASFHHIDRLLGQTLLMLNLNGVLELGGIAAVFTGAVWRFRQIRSSRLHQIGSGKTRV